MEGELRQRIKEADYDAVLGIRPRAFRKETQEVGTKSVYMPPPFYQNLGHIGTCRPSSTPRKVPVSRKTPLSAPSLIFTAPRMKPISRVEKQTPFIRQTFQRLGKEYASALVKQLKKRQGSLDEWTGRVAVDARERERRWLAFV